MAALQIKSFYKEVIPVNKYVADDVAISIDARKVDKQIFLDDDFLPMAVYYADKKIFTIRELELYGIFGINHTLVDFFKSNQKDFAVITRVWAINNLVSEKIPFKIVAKNNSFVIVTR